MKRIIYLTFYFKPDLCAGSFRNSPLAIELANQAKSKNILIDVYTTIPNRYSTYNKLASELEYSNNLRIHRILLPTHKNGMFDQVFSFRKFYKEVRIRNINTSAELVFASSSRLFTAFLGYSIAKKINAPLYLDIRDIFLDTINDVIRSKILKSFLLPVLKRIERKTFNYATHINLISGGFKQYFNCYSNSKKSFYTNGIDEEFILKKDINLKNNLKKKENLIVYAGNIGDGQGLHKLVPKAAKLLGNNYKFLIIGDGGKKKLLKTEIDRLNLKNVILKPPVSRSKLQKCYIKADYFLIHLNDYPAFKKVLPSKIFELATFKKPILAGVSGYCAKFVTRELKNSFVFEPCDVKKLVNYLQKNKESSLVDNRNFIKKFRRSRINIDMSKSILSYL